MFKTWLWLTWKTFLCVYFCFTKKKITSCYLNTYFMKKWFSYFATQVEISNVSFSHLSYFRDFVFNSDSNQLRKISAYLLVVSRKKNTSCSASTHYYHFLTQIKNSKVSLSLFLYFRNFFFQIKFWKFQINIFRAFFGCTWKNVPLMA